MKTDRIWIIDLKNEQQRNHCHLEKNWKIVLQQDNETQDMILQDAEDSFSDFHTIHFTVSNLFRHKLPEILTQGQDTMTTVVAYCMVL